MAEGTIETIDPVADNEGVPVSQAPAAKPVEFDREALEAKIAGKFDSVFTDDDAEEPEVVADPEPDATVSTVADETGGTEPTAEKTEAKVEEAAADPKAPTLPAAYRRSLKAYEWTDDEIDNALASGGDKFVLTAQKMHANRNKEVADWAAAGRAARQQTPASTQQPVVDEVLKPVDAKALKAKYGDEALIDDIVGPVNAVVERINKMLPQVQRSQQQSQQQELETLDRQVQAFFGGKELEPYSDVYGKGSSLTQEHVATRQKVLETADALIGGAKLQGKRLSLDDALTMAHDSVTAPVKEQAARKQVAAALQTRNKGLTLKPNTRGAVSSTANSGRVSTREQLENRVKLSMRKLFA